MTGKIMPLCERGTSTIEALARRLLVRAAVRQPGYPPWLCRQPRALAAATHSDSSAVARTPVSADRRGSTLGSSPGRCRADQLSILRSKECEEAALS